MQWKPNVTVAAIIENDNQFLIVEEMIDGKSVYNQPAGHLEENETLVDAVKREVMEETAHDFEPEFVTGIYLFKPDNNPLTYLRVCFTGQYANTGITAALDEGIVAAKWMSMEQLLEEKSKLRTSLVMTCIEDYLKGMRYPLDILR